MGPLDGITILDFTQAYNGPYCTMNLADMGARVIKVERADGGDQSRFWTPFSENGGSGYFATYNRNKEGIAVDLNTMEGKELIKRLYRQADVVLENFKFGTMDKLGVGYEVALKENPEIIFASSTGFGQNGPLCKNTAYDNVIESMCGYMEMTGFPEYPPLRSGASVADSYTGLTMCLAIVLACYEKRRTGKGCRIDLAMLDVMFSTLDSAVLTYSLTGKETSRTGNARPAELVPYDTYYCADGFIAVTITDESMWPGFCLALGKPELIKNPEFMTNDLRCRNVESFTALISGIMAEKRQDELLKSFLRFNVPATKIYTPLDAMEHPQLLARDMVIDVEDANVGNFRTFGIPVKFSETEGTIRKSSPRLGEDTYKVMKEAGYTECEIRKMAENEVVVVCEESVQ